MARPQQPELARSAKTDLDPDHVETGLQGQRHPGTAGETGPVPPENQPGHHPPKEQDKPDLDAFAARLGTDPDAPTATAARKGPRKATAAKTTPAKATPTKSTPAKSTPAKSTAKSAASKAASRPAAPASTAAQASPAAPPTIEATPGKRPAAAPMAWPESAPSRESASEMSVGDSEPQQQQHQQQEPFYVGLMLLPLRGTVKWLEQLERTLTDRFTGRSSSGGAGS